MSAEPDDADIVSTRLLAADREAVFEAFVGAEKLASWWGPAGFTNEFHIFQPWTGGAWKFTMRGPDGTPYEMSKRFEEVSAPERIVILHLEPEVHRFWLTSHFREESGGTRVTWHLRFESAAEAERVRDVVTAANEENLDRLEALLARE